MEEIYLPDNVEIESSIKSHKKNKGSSSSINNASICSPPFYEFEAESSIKEEFSFELEAASVPMTFKEIDLSPTVESILDNELVDNELINADFLLELNDTETSNSNNETKIGRKKHIQSTKDILSDEEKFSYIAISRLILNNLAINYPLFNNHYSVANISFTQFSNKLMKIIYRHLNINVEEQNMVEKLIDHGMKPSDFIKCFVKKKEIEISLKELPKEKETVHSKNENLDINNIEIKKVASQNINFPIEEIEQDLDQVNLADDIRPNENTKDLKSSSSSEKVIDKQLKQNTSVQHIIDSRNNSNLVKKVDIDVRWTIVLDLFLVLTQDDIYDSRSRTFLFALGRELGLSNLDIVKLEKQVSEQFMLVEFSESIHHAKEASTRNKSYLKKRLALMGLATIGGSVIIGLSAGLLAPVIGTGLGAAFTSIGIAGTGAFLHGVGGVAIITTSGVLIGGGLGGTKMENRTKGIRTFEFVPINDTKRANVIITITGWLPNESNDVGLPFSVLDPVEGDHFSLFWEPETLKELGSALKIFAGEVLSFATTQILQHTLLGTLMSAISWPLALLKLAYLVDNPWSTGLDRAEKAGLVLADVLMNHAQGFRPVTLVGYSLGARVIFYCLLELARVKAFGIIENVYLFGAPVTASTSQWSQANSIVSGELVNCYLKTDWILGFLYRASSASISIAGLQPIILDSRAKIAKGITMINDVEVFGEKRTSVQRIRNVDVTHIVSGHLAYRKLIPKLLKEVIDLNITADFFLDPDDIEDNPPKDGTELQVSDQLEAVMGPNRPLNIDTSKNPTPSRPKSFMNKLSPLGKKFAMSTKAFKSNFVFDKLKMKGERKDIGNSVVESLESIHSKNQSNSLPNLKNEFEELYKNDPSLKNLLVHSNDFKVSKEETEEHSTDIKVKQSSVKRKIIKPKPLEFDSNFSDDSESNQIEFDINNDPLMITPTKNEYGQSSFQKAAFSNKSSSRHTE